MSDLGQDHVITWELVSLIGVIVGGALGLWRLVMGEVSSARVDCEQKIKVMSDDLVNFKLHVTREFATADHIDKVEGKLTDAIYKLIEEVKLLRDDMVATRLEVRKGGGTGRNAAR